MKKNLFFILSFLGLFQFSISPSFGSSFAVKSAAAVAATGLVYSAYKQLYTRVYNRGLEFIEPSAEQRFIFESLKQHMNIKESIDFKLFVDKYKKWTDAIAIHHGRRNLISLRHDAPIDIFTIFAIAHEFEHHRQKYKYPDSYYGTDQAKQEYSADTAAITLITCPDCVEKIKKHRYSCDHNRCNKEVVSHGYWGPEEFNRYRDWLISNGFRQNSDVINNYEMVFAQ